MALVDNTATAEANHLTCWRSTPIERRSLTNSEAAATSPRAYRIVSTGFMVSVATSMPRGWLTRSNPAAVSGQSATETVPVTITTPTSHAKGRQRDEGSLPSGNSKARNTKRPMCKTHSHEEIQAKTSPPGSMAGTDLGSANNVTMAYSETKRRIPAIRPMEQKIQPIGFLGGSRRVIMAPTVEKLIAITVFSSQ